jgi:hypothetical protein
MSEQSVGAFPPGTAYTPGSNDLSSQYQAWVEQFKAYVVHLAQQETSRLRTCVREEMVTGEYHNFERLAATDAVVKTSRHTPTPVLNAEHSRRKLIMSDFLWGDMIDEEDQIRALISYTGAYTQNAAMSMGREWDKLIITAAWGNALETDENRAIQNVALPAGQKIAAGTTQLTISKVTQAKYILDSNEIAAENRYIVVSAQEIQSMLNTTEITSSDYNTVKALRNGEVDFFLGFEWKRTELLDTTLDANASRRCLAWQKDSMGLGVGRDVTTKIDQRPDFSYAWQVFAAFSANAVRIQDEGVVEIGTALVPA